MSETPHLGSRARIRIATILTLACGGALPIPLQAESTDAFAKGEVHEGQLAYDLGRFEEALAAYSAAYEAKPLPGLLFDIGQCHRHLGHAEQAAFFYRRFLDKVPGDGPEAAVARTLLAEVVGAAGSSAPRSPEPALVVINPARTADPPRASGAGSNPPDLSLPTNRETISTASAAPTLVPGPLTDEKARSSPVVERWWFWAGVAAIVVGGAAAAYVATQPHAPAPTLGTIQGT